MDIKLIIGIAIYLIGVVVSSRIAAKAILKSSGFIRRDDAPVIGFLAAASWLGVAVVLPDYLFDGYEVLYKNPDYKNKNKGKEQLKKKCRRKGKGRVFRVVKRYAETPRVYNYRVDELKHFLFIPYWDIGANSMLDIEDDDEYSSPYFRTFERAAHAIVDTYPDSKIKYFKEALSD